MEERATNADPRPLSQLASSTKTPADYLASLPPPPPSSLADRPLAAAELARVASGQPLPPLDASRFRLDPPPASRRSDPGAWRAALDNARAQLEHQHTRLLNLELLLQHGPRAAAAAAAHAEAGAGVPTPGGCRRLRRGRRQPGTQAGPDGGGSGDRSRGGRVAVARRHVWRAGGRLCDVGG